MQCIDTVPEFQQNMPQSQAVLASRNRYEYTVVFGKHRVRPDRLLDLFMRKVNETGFAKCSVMARQFQDCLHFTTRTLHREIDHKGNIATNANEKRETAGGGEQVAQ